MTSTQNPRPRRNQPRSVAAGLFRLSEVKPEKVQWLWPGYLPRGKVIIVEGHPSAGKSTLVSDIAARVTTGAEWPDGSPGIRPAGVLLLSAEDGLSDTVVPRLKAADADMDRVYLLNEVEDEDGDMVMPSVPKHIPQIEKHIKDNRVGLVIVDVLMAYLEGDSYRDQAVRKMLTPLAQMAARTGACIVLIRHLKKSGKKGSAIMNGSGSIGIIGAARGSFLVAVDEHEHEKRLFACVKMNIAKEPPTLAYRLIDTPDLGVAHCEWEPDPVNVSAEDLGVKMPTDERRSEQDEATEWLVGYLDDNGGSAPANKVIEDGKAIGFSLDTLKKAKKAAGVDSMKSVRFDGAWSWIAPPSIDL